MQQIQNMLFFSLAPFFRWEKMQPPDFWGHTHPVRVTLVDSIAEIWQVSNPQLQPFAWTIQYRENGNGV